MPLRSYADLFNVQEPNIAFEGCETEFDQVTGGLARDLELFRGLDEGSRAAFVAFVCGEHLAVIVYDLVSLQFNTIHVSLCVLLQV